MKRVQTLLAIVCLLICQVVSGQTYYQTEREANGKLGYFKDSYPGYGAFDVKIDGSLPNNAVLSKKGINHRVPYKPESWATWNWSQFGKDKYFSPTFKFCIDAGGHLSINERRSYGINLFNQFTISADYQGILGRGKGIVDWRNQLQPGEGMWYATQNILADYQHAPNFFCRSLQEFFTNAWNVIPAFGYGIWENYKYFVWNLETAVFGIEPQYFSDWNTIKTKPFKMESTNETITLEALWNRGRDSWNAEMWTRRATRMALLCEIVKKKANPAKNIKVSIGYSPYVFYYAWTSRKTDNGSFFPGFAIVRYVGGDAQGNITFKNVPGIGTWTVNLSGDGLSHSDFLQGYHYETDIPGLSESDYNSIFVARNSGVNSQAEIWAKIDPSVHPSCGIVAVEKGWIQLNRMVTANRTGKPKPPVMTQKENIYESSAYHLPFPRVQNILESDGTGRYTPRLGVAPFIHYSSYCVTRFLAGNEEGWGWYLFPISQIRAILPPNKVDNEGKISRNYDLHTESSILQARHDMQPYETYYTGSELVEDPEVQLNQTGPWLIYDGIDALNTDQGGWNPDKPAYMLRWKAVNGGWRVVILGGARLGWQQERIDLIRVPGGGVGKNMFRIKLRGPAAQVFDFFVPSNASGQIFDAVHTPVPNREKPGYAGWTSN